MNHKPFKVPFSGTLIAVSLTYLAAMPSQAQTDAAQFDEIRVAGNERLSDQEVLELCDISAGKAYNSATLQTMVACLGKSGQFKGVSLETESRDLIIKVDEAPKYTGFLDISVSADSDRGLSSRLLLEDQDLFNLGLQGNFELEVAREEKSVSATLAKPDLWGRGWTGGVALSYSEVDYDDQSFSYRRAVLGPFLTIPLADQQSLTLRAGVQADELYGVSASASPVLQREAGERVSPFIGVDYNAIYLPKTMPNTRFALQASQKFVGIGEDHLFSITQLGLQTTTSVIADKLNLSFGFEAGHIEELGGEGARVLDRFQLGGASFRGFAPRGLGPSDGGDRLGGTSYAVAQIESNSPLTQIGGVQLEGGVFVDVGMVSGLGDQAGFNNPIDDSIHMRSTAGLSLTAKIGSVPLTMYYAKPIESFKDDKVQAFGISIQRRF